jgi:hypothetical protein
MSDLYNNNNINGINKIYEERNKNKNIQSINVDNIFTFKYDKDTVEKNESINFDSINRKPNKKCIFRSHSIKPQRNLSNLECNNEVNENNQKGSERRNKFFNNYCTISNQIEIFQTRLKQIRKKSQETNRKIDLLLTKRRKHILLEGIRNNFNDISYNKKNSTSDLYNINNSNINGMNKINEERNKNKNIQSIDGDKIFTFKYDKDTVEKNESINFDSINRKPNKKCLFRSHSIKQQRNLSNIECNNEVNENNPKGSERRNKIFNNFCTISNQIEIFQTRLKQIRKKSQETNKKIDLLLSKRRKHLLLDGIRNNFNDINYNNKNQKIKINTKNINNGQIKN